MHRQTGINNSFRGHTSGGARTLIDTVDDGKLMQEMKGSMHKGEGMEGVESPQNYGFTSVCMPATRGDDGQIDSCAEGFISYIGGNREIPVCSVMDDRRHRLKSDDNTKMDPGDSAMYRTKDDLQQMHLGKDGTFFSARSDKKIHRMALVPPPDDQQQQFPVGGGGYEGGAKPSGGQGGKDEKTGSMKKATGQTHLIKQNQKSEIAFEQNNKENYHQHGQQFSSTRGGSDTTIYSQGSRKYSSQSTDDHTHIRWDDHRIFNDDGGNWCTSPLGVKKDPHCKE